MSDSTATLIGYGTPIYDQYGNETMPEIRTNVFVQPRGVYSSEFYQAAQTGLHPSITFEMTNRADYDGEKLIEWNGKVYTIIRVDWTAQRDNIRLICEERING